MPDWSYHPLFRPLLFRLPAPQARRATLGFLAALGAHPLGPRLIALMGHMAPPPSLRRELLGLSLSSPVGLGAGVDVDGEALAALSRFGLGFLTVGPVTLAPIAHPHALVREKVVQAIWHADLAVNAGADALIAQLARQASHRVPLGVQLACAPGSAATAATEERRTLIERLAPWSDFFVVDSRAVVDGRWDEVVWRDHLATLHRAAHACLSPRPLLLAIAPDTNQAQAHTLVAGALEVGVRGIVVGGGVRAPDDGYRTGAPTQATSLELVRALRGRWGQAITLIGSGGVHAPADALAFLDAGADLVQLASGLVYAGPGLPKRIGEAIHARHEAAVPARSHRPPLWHQSTLWMLLLGLGMIASGLVAAVVAGTRVVLPYDEAFVCLSRAELAALNARLLPFMAHDRVTLAATMVSIGVLYVQLTLHALRHGVHWAFKALRASALAGFASFLLFLGYGYFDPLHGLLTLLLLPCYLLGLRGERGAPPRVPLPDLHNDRAWRLAQWGQLLLVGLGAGLVIAGATIALVGVTTVFVPEDLAYLQTTAAALEAANARLLPLIAHDRAGFGGALFSNGLAVLLIALWGVRRGARWVWWTILLGGIPGFLGALGVHFVIGYTDPWHLAPAVAALVVYLLGLALSYPYLVGAQYQEHTHLEPLAALATRIG
jgi:dihydroorotate dehydrogenase